MKTLAVIPARFGASRFPGKPLALLWGKPMIEHVYRRCEESRAFQEIVVATEDERVAKAVKAFGGRVCMTSPACPSGSDRVAEVARQMSCADSDVLINVQGDEPAIHPESLSTLVEAFSQPHVEMATLVRPLEESERGNPNVVKVVLRLDGHALYFSRSDIPFQREPHAMSPPRYAHLGIYGYRQSTLQQLSSLPATPLEKSEFLEQLRALENGISILCRMTPHRTAAVDVPEDISVVESLLKLRNFT